MIFKKKKEKPVNTDPIAVDEVLTRGVVDCVEREHLRKRMLAGERLRIKFGIDPTSPHIHLGHTVPLRKLRQFQDLGHQAVLIIGDATAMIGDPTGRSEARKQLSREVIDDNKKTYVAQAGKVLDLDTLEIRHNGEWFDGMSAAEFLGLTSLVTVQQVLQREDFRQRIESEDHPLTAIELTYPVMQGYDSVMVQADVEIGGHDQLLNVLMGRRMQRKFGMPEQDVLTVPLLEGTDGSRKMSKSFGNSVFLDTTPEDMFGQIMSIPDTHIIPYLMLATAVPMANIKLVEENIQNGSNPRDEKVRLATVLVDTFHGIGMGAKAAEHFSKVFSAGEMPEEMPEFALKKESPIIDVLVETGLVTSRGEARRMIEQGAIKVNSETISAIDATVAAGVVLQRGKRQFVRLK